MCIRDSLNLEGYITVWEVGSFLLHPPTESNGAEHKEEEQEGNKEETRRDPTVFNTISSPAQRLIRTFLSNSFIYFLRDCRGNEKEAHMKITTSEINVLSLLLTPPCYDQFAWCRRDLISIPFSMNIDW